MPGGIFVLDADNKLTAMSESPFAVELDFQKLLADHPDLLPGDQIDPESPRRWLLVSREVGIPDDAGMRWSLDHLFLDQEGVPTLVEVKRGADPRVRREVVGQLLDYAANAVLHWTEETIRTSFEERCRRENLEPERELVDLLQSSPEPGDFWQRVKTNLQAGKIRLIFVADAIPPELRRVVEFLNHQMDPAEVLAVEIRQYAGGTLKTLVPRVMGQTAETLVRKGNRPIRPWDEATLLAELAARRSQAEADVARRIIRWAEQKGCRPWWGKGTQDGSFFPMVDHTGDTYWTFAIWTYGSIEIQFQYMRTKPPFNVEAKRYELRAKLLGVAPEFNFPEQGIEKRPSLPLRALTDEAALARFLEVMGWVVDEIRKV